MLATEERSFQILKLLQAEIDCASKLVLALDQEYVALTRRDTVAISSMAQHKQEIISKLETLGKSREGLMTISESSPAAPKSDSGGEPYRGDAQLSALWNELKSVALQCQEKNLINGRIVEVGFQQSRQALNILRGDNSGAGLYDKSGRASPSTKTGTRFQV